MRGAVAACSLGLLGLGSVEALAGERLPVRLEYEASPSCPDAHRFEKEVRARLREGRMAQNDEPARSFRIRLTDEGSRKVARLWVEEGPQPARILEAESCDQVMVAMALVTALVMDGRPIGPSPPPPSSSQPTSEPPETVREAPPAPSAPPLVVTPPTPPSPETSLREPPALLPLPAALEAIAEPEPPHPLPAKRSLLSLGLRVGTESALGPEPLFGGQVALGHESETGRELRVFVSWLEGRAVDAGPGRARFGFVGGGLEACQAMTEPLSGLRIGPCLGLEAGALRGEGLAFGAIVEPKRATRLWMAGRMLGQLRFRAGSLAAEIAGGAVLPLTRSSFVFETPHSVVHETPLLGFTLLGGGQVAFP